MILIPDTIDLSAYMRGDSDVAVLVRPAASFLEDLQAEFAPRPAGERVAEMFSTKLRDRIAFRPGEVTGYAGYNGHRKSMFVSQVAIDLMCQGQKTLIASFEMSPAKTLARMARQIFGVSSPTPAQIERFAKWTNGRLWIFNHVGRITPERCVAVCRYFSQEIKGDQAVLDSMMMICKSEEHLDEQKQFMTDTVRTAHETGLHIHLVAHCRKPLDESKPPSKYDLRGSAAISDQAHNIVIIWANLEKKRKQEAGQSTPELDAEPDARVTIEKQRNGPWEGACKLWFDKASLRFMDDRTSAVQSYAQLVRT